MIREEKKEIEIRSKERVMEKEKELGLNPEKVMMLSVVFEGNGVFGSKIVTTQRIDVKFQVLIFVSSVSIMQIGFTHLFPHIYPKKRKKEQKKEYRGTELKRGEKKKCVFDREEGRTFYSVLLCFALFFFFFLSCSLFSDVALHETL